MEPLLSIALILQIRFGALNPCFEEIDMKALTRAGSGGPMASFIPSVSHSNGVVLYEILKTRLKGYPFTKFIRKCFSEAFSDNANARGLSQS